METAAVLDTPCKISSEQENPVSELKTPPPVQRSDRISSPSPQEHSGNELSKIFAPDRLKVPKAFKYPERYRSPTDAMMSPVTKGLLARNRKGVAALLPPSINTSKIQEIRVPEKGLFQNETSSIEC